MTLKWTSQIFATAFFRPLLPAKEPRALNAVLKLTRLYRNIGLEVDKSYSMKKSYTSKKLTCMC